MANDKAEKDRYVTETGSSEGYIPSSGNSGIWDNIEEFFKAFFMGPSYFGMKEAAWQDKQDRAERQRGEKRQARAEEKRQSGMEKILDVYFGGVDDTMGTSWTDPNNARQGMSTRPGMPDPYAMNEAPPGGWFPGQGVQSREGTPITQNRPAGPADLRGAFTGSDLDATDLLYMLNYLGGPDILRDAPEVPKAQDTLSEEDVRTILSITQGDAARLPYFADNPEYKAEMDYFGNMRGTEFMDFYRNAAGIEPDQGTIRDTPQGLARIKDDGTIEILMPPINKPEDWISGGGGLYRPSEGMSSFQPYPVTDEDKAESDTFSKRFKDKSWDANRGEYTWWDTETEKQVTRGEAQMLLAGTTESPLSGDEQKVYQDIYNKYLSGAEPSSLAPYLQALADQYGLTEAQVIKIEDYFMSVIEAEMGND